MKRIILFRFHKLPLVCKNRLKLLRKYNPHIKIYGLYGGKQKDLSLMRKYLKEDLLNIFNLPEDKKWKWLNSDFALRAWFINYGKNIDFDILYLIEWDLIYFDSLKKIYKNIPPEGMALTGLTLLKNVQDRWSWTTEKPTKKEWLTLLSYVRKNFNYNKQPLASLGPGPVIPRKFLVEYSKIEVQKLAHDELRLPLFAQIFGIKLFDTGFYKKWFDNGARKYFNCINKLIDLEIIKRELNKENGIKVFHPYRKILSEEIFN